MVYSRRGARKPAKKSRSGKNSRYGKNKSVKRGGSILARALPSLVLALGARKMARTHRRRHGKNAARKTRRRGRKSRRM
jgi:hypothetical protein